MGFLPPSPQGPKALGLLGRLAFTQTGGPGGPLERGGEGRPPSHPGLLFAELPRTWQDRAWTNTEHPQQKCQISKHPLPRRGMLPLIQPQSANCP